MALGLRILPDEGFAAGLRRFDRHGQCQPPRALDPSHARRRARRTSSSTMPNSRAMRASDKGDQAVIDGAKSMAMTALDLMARSQACWSRAQSRFRSDRGTVASGASQDSRDPVRDRHATRTWRLRLRMNALACRSPRSTVRSPSRSARLRRMGLHGRLDAHALQIFETGARYHMYHALAIGLAALAMRGAAAARAATWSADFSSPASFCFPVRSICWR